MLFTLTQPCDSRLSACRVREVGFPFLRLVFSKKEGCQLSEVAQTIISRGETTENTNSDNDLEEVEKVEDVELEAKFVAQKIRDLIDSKFQVYDNKKEEFRDIRFRDIVILLRSTKNKANIFDHFHLYIKFLSYKLYHLL